MQLLFEQNSICDIIYPYLRHGYEFLMQKHIIDEKVRSIVIIKLTSGICGDRLVTVTKYTSE